MSGNTLIVSVLSPSGRQGVFDIPVFTEWPDGYRFGFVWLGVGTKNGSSVDKIASC